MEAKQNIEIQKKTQIIRKTGPSDVKPADVMHCYQETMKLSDKIDKYEVEIEEIEQCVKKKTLEYKDQIFKSLRMSINEAEEKCKNKI